MYAWEKSFIEVITKLRQKEITKLKQIAYLRAFSRAYMGAIPPFTAAISLTVYTLAVEGNEMDASTLFAAITAFNQLRFPLLFYPMFFAQYVQAKVSLQRLADFLMMSEVDETGG